MIAEATKTGRCSPLKDPYSGLLEKLIVKQVVKKCPALYRN
jgi:hypothetical protein